MTQFLARTLVLLAAALGVIAVPTFAQTVSIHPGLSGCTGTGALLIPVGGGTADFHICVNAPATKTCGVGYRITASASNGMTVARTLGTAYADPIVSAGTFGNGTNNALTPTSGQAGSLIVDSSTFVAPANGILAAAFTLTVPAAVAAGTYTVGPTAALVNVTASSSCADAGASDFTPPAVAPLNVVKAAAATAATFTSSPSTLTFVEGGPAQNITVSCAGTIGTPSPVVITVGSTGTGFTPAAAPLSFTTCPSSQTVAVTPRAADAGSNPPQTGNVTFATVTVGATAPASVGVTVNDLQSPAVYNVTKTTATVTEGNVATDTLTVTCTGAFTGGLTAGSVQYAITGLTNPGDIATPALTGALNFPACGGATQSITISPRVNDAVVQGNKSGTFTISTPVAGTLGTPTAGTINVNDDDTPQTVTVAVSGSPATEAGGVLTYTFTRAGGNAAAVAATLPINVTLNNAAPAATSRFSTTCTSVVTFVASFTTASCTVTGIDNLLVDGNVNVVVAVAPPTVTGSYLVGMPASASGVIADDDSPQSVSVAVSGSPASENGGVLTYTFTRSGGSAAAQAAALTATIAPPPVNARYTTTCGATVTFVAAFSTATCTVTGVNNAVVDGNVSVVVTVVANAAANPPYSVGSPSSATGTIVDDEVGVSVTGTSATEGSPVTFTITCTGTLAGPVLIPYTIAGVNTPDGPAPVGPASIASCPGSVTIVVPTFNDTTVGNTRTFTITLGTLPPGTAANGPLTASASAIDNDVPLTIPTMGVIGLGLMSLMLVGLAGFQRRRLGR